MSYTPYTLYEPYLSGPRCRNTHTLTPLFVLRDAAGQLVTDPVPIEQVPAEHFWQNSEGYGFDLRNLAVLLKVNFRNLNPHTVAADGTFRPLWCNNRDMASLLAVLPDNIRQNAFKRVAILNDLSDLTKRKLAVLAGELYSYTYTGLVQWLVTVPADVLTGLGLQSDVPTLIQEIQTLAAARRALALEGIMQHAGTQANQHFAEPAGVAQGSDLYRVMEFYKATKVQDFLSYAAGLDHARQTAVADFDDRVMEYVQIQFLGLCERYSKVLRREPRHTPRFMLWHWIFKVRSLMAPIMHRGLRPRPTYQVVRHVHVRVFYNSTTNVFEVDQDTNPSQICTDSVQLWVHLRTIVHVGATVHMATLAGGIFEICQSPRWKRTLQRDNVLVHTLARLFVVPDASLIRYINSLAALDPASNITEIYLRVMGTDEHRISRAVQTIARAYFKARLYETVQLNKIMLHGGYDNGPGPLLKKLRDSLDGFTCVQDIAAELCEFLSVPFPPEKPEHAAFQVNHTGIPDVHGVHVALAAPTTTTR